MSTWLIVGLGNPGLNYKQTRHNIGFQAVDFLTGDNKAWQINKKGNYLYLKTELLGCQAMLIKPQTFMNNAGSAVSYASRHLKLKPQKIIIIYDELDLPFGAIRVRPKGSSAGHNGINSVINHLKTENFWRVRLGIKNDLSAKMPAEKYVLQKFFPAEEKILLSEIFPQLGKKMEKIIKGAF